MKTTIFDIKVLPLPDGSELACVIYRQANGKLIIQPAFYSSEQVALFDEFMSGFAEFTKGILDCNQVSINQSLN